MSDDLPSNEAERIYADALERWTAEVLGRLEPTAEVDLEELRRRHPHVANELTALHEASGVGRKLLGAMQRRAAAGAAGERRGSADGVLSRMNPRLRTSDRYRIDGEVARGGQGVVLRVWDEELLRPLAMKLVLDDGDDDSEGPDERTLARFLEEAQVTGQLDHPGIVPVHELGLDTERRVYFTMKLVKGEDLRAVYQRVHAGEAGWSVTRAVGVLHKVCEAMAYAHAKGVVHRDLKPANIMVGRFGEVFVMDWGLARVLDEPDSRDSSPRAEPRTVELRSSRHEAAGATPDSPLLTADGEVMGTPAYMAPEQAAGLVDAVGPHSDVYALGAMLYHLLGGHMPYVDPGTPLDHVAVWQRVQAGPPPSLTDRRSSCDEALVAICDRAMARRPEDRYADVQALADDLRAYLEGRVVAAHESGAIAELRKWVGRNRLAASALASAALILIVGSAAVLQQSFVAKRARRAADANAARAIGESYVANIRAASMALDGDQIQRASRHLHACGADQRGWEWWRLALMLESPRVLLVGPTSRPVHSAISPDGRMAVAGCSDGEVILWSVPEGTLVHRRNPFASSVGPIAFHPDGSRVAVCGDGQLVLLSTVDGDVLRRIGLPAGLEPSRILFSVDGERIIFTHHTVLGAVNAASGEWIDDDARPAGAIRSIVRTDDLLAFVVAGVNGSTVWDEARRGVLRTFDEDSQLFVVRSAGGRYVRTLVGGGVRSGYLAAASERQIVELDGGVLRIELSDDGRFAFATSPPGNGLPWGRMIALDDPRLLWSLDGGYRGSSVVTFIGGELLVRRPSGTLAFLDARTGRERTRVRSLDGIQFDERSSPTAGFVMTQNFNALEPRIYLTHDPIRDSPAVETPPTSSLARFDSTGASVTVACEDGTRLTFDGTTGESRDPIDDLRAHVMDHLDRDMITVDARFPNRTSVTTDGRRFAIVEDGGREVTVRDGTTGQVRTHWTSVDSRIHAVSLSGDGRIVVCVREDGFAEVREIETGETLARFYLDAEFSDEPELPALDTSFDGETIVFSYPNVMWIWNRTSGSLEQFGADRSSAVALAFHPDGSRVAAGHFDPLTAHAEIVIWDCERREDLLTIELEPAQVPGRLEFSPDGERLLLSIRGSDHRDRATGRRRGAGFRLFHSRGDPGGGHVYR